MAASLDIVLPVFNEEKDLPASVSRLLAFLPGRLDDYDWRIVIADNGSTDSTPDVAGRLSKRHTAVEQIRIEEPGRGRALRAAWLQSGADVMGYMDVDLSTDLDALPRLVRTVGNEGYDIAIGSRLARGAEVIGRSWTREITSRAYSLIFRLLFPELFFDPRAITSMFLTGFRDAQCGFKALSRLAAHELAPLVEDGGWFFDTELLILAERNGYRIKELAVRWTDDPDSKVKVAATAYRDLRGLARLRLGGLGSASRRLSRRTS